MSFLSGRCIVGCILKRMLIHQQNVLLAGKFVSIHGSRLQALCQQSRLRSLQWAVSHYWQLRALAASPTVHTRNSFDFYRRANTSHAIVPLVSPAFGAVAIPR